MSIVHAGRTVNGWRSNKVVKKWEMRNISSHNELMKYLDKRKFKDFIKIEGFLATKPLLAFFR